MRRSVGFLDRLVGLFISIVVLAGGFVGWRACSNLVLKRPKLYLDNPLAQPLVIAIDGKSIGTVTPHTFIATNVGTGVHTVTARMPSGKVLSKTVRVVQGIIAMDQYRALVDVTGTGTYAIETASYGLSTYGPGPTSAPVTESNGVFELPSHIIGEPDEPLPLSVKTKYGSTAMSHFLRVPARTSIPAGEVPGLSRDTVNVASINAGSQVVLGLEHVISVRVGGHHACALNQAGGVFCWGANNHGQLGIENSGHDSAVPVSVPTVTGIVEISVGENHTCARTQAGTVKCWGDNTHGELGDNAPARTLSAPVDVVGISDAVSLASGEWHTCVATKSGEVLCWGRNQFGQLGNQMLGEDNSTSTPGKVTDDIASPMMGVLSVSAGSAHTCARNDAKTWCWGRGDVGQIGGVEQSITTTAKETFRPAAGLTLGFETTCFEDGSRYCQGAGADPGYLAESPQLDAPRASRTWLPTGLVAAWAPLVTEVSYGRQHACAVLSNNRVVCWGSNGHGALSVAPARMPGSRAAPKRVSDLTAVTRIVANGNIACAQKADSALWCWGVLPSTTEFDARGARAQARSAVTPQLVPLTDRPEHGVLLGDGTICSRSVSEWGATCLPPRGDFRVREPSAMGFGVLCGRGIYGAGMRCQHGTATDVLWSDTALVPRTAAPSDALSLGVGDGFSCLISTRHVVKCVGKNTSGQSGMAMGAASVVGTVTLPASPLAVVTGRAHACALLADHTVACWGDDQFGQLGDGVVGNPAQRETAARVESLTDVTTLVAGGDHTCVLHTDGGVSCWGRNNALQLGSESGDEARSSHVRGLTGIQAIAAGTEFNCALGTDGAVSCWGTNLLGQLGVVE